MRNFDYFDAKQKVVELPKSEDSPFDMQLAAFRRLRQRFAGALLLSVSLTAVGAWFIWRERGNIGYAFRTPHRPLELGDVVEITPDQIPHNAYVQLEGITEHRGLSQKVVRDFRRQEYWYFRLHGSRGVFIETERDPERWSYNLRVKVEGRAIDPQQDRSYDLLLNSYQQQFSPQRQGSHRVIQVGVRPGAGKWRFLLAFTLLAGMVGLNIFMMSKYVRLRRATPGEAIMRKR